MSYITTYTGKHFDPIQPEPGLFDLTDISHALSLLCRGNGHMKHFYTGKKRPGLLSKSGSAASGSSVGVFYSGTGFERRGTRTGF